MKKTTTTLVLIAFTILASLCLWSISVQGKIDPGASETIEVSVSTASPDKRLPEKLASRFLRIAESLKNGDTSGFLDLLSSEERHVISPQRLHDPLAKYHILFERRSQSNDNNGNVLQQTSDIVVHWITDHGNRGVSISSWVWESEDSGWMCTDVGFMGI